jgi:taurine dioxygenase
MLSIEPSGGALGATIRGANLSKPLSDGEIGQIMQAMGEHKVVAFPGQNMTAAEIRDFSLQLGPVQIPEGPKEPGVKEISVLSNIFVDGKPLGALDAGMIWHKDMTYQKDIGWATVLHALKVPHRDGKPLGATRFANCEAAYRDLPEEIKKKLEGVIGIHNSVMYNAKVRGAGSTRAPYSAEKAAKKIPLPHPAVLTHPITGRKILYVDPGHVERLEGLPEQEGADLLKFLGEHQLQDKYQWAHKWSVGDVLMWDNMSSLHCATLDYKADEHRLMKRCQILPDKIRDQAYLQHVMAEARAA